MTSSIPDLPRQAWSSADGADLYERARPGYAPEAITFIAQQLGIGPGDVVLDVGAGTGKLSRQLLTLGAEVIAVEPLKGMRSALARSVPGVEILEGRAETLPLPDASVTALVAGQAWHWFDSSLALAEASRVVRNGGGLALLWNEYDGDAPWAEEYAAIRKRVNSQSVARHPSHTEETWRQAFEDSAAWTPLQNRGFRHVVEMTREAFVDRVFSSSVFSVLPEAGKERVRGEIRAMLDRSARVTGVDTVSVPYVTEVFWSHLRVA